MGQGKSDYIIDLCWPARHDIVSSANAYVASLVQPASLPLFNPALLFLHSHHASPSFPPLLPPFTPFSFPLFFILSLSSPSSPPHPPLPHSPPAPSPPPSPSPSSLSLLLPSIPQELCMASYSCQVAKLHIEHYLYHLLSSTPGLYELPSNATVSSHIPSHNPTHLSPETARLKDCISVLFIFERRPIQDESFTTNCRMWLDVLVSAVEEEPLTFDL